MKNIAKVPTPSNPRIDKPLSRIMWNTHTTGGCSSRWSSLSRTMSAPSAQSSGTSCTLFVNFTLHSQKHIWSNKSLARRETKHYPKLNWSDFSWQIHSWDQGQGKNEEEGIWFTAHLQGRYPSCHARVPQCRLLRNSISEDPSDWHLYVPPEVASNPGHSSALLHLQSPPMMSWQAV